MDGNLKRQIQAVALATLMTDVKAMQAQIGPKAYRDAMAAICGHEAFDALVQMCPDCGKLASEFMIGPDNN